MNKLCKRILKYLHHSKQWKENKNVYDECVLLNYWIYNELDTYFSKNPSYINIAFSGLQLIWEPLTENSKNSFFYKKCKPMFKQILDHQDWKQRKELYDYYVDYDTLFGTAWGFPDKCEEYYEKIQKMISVYKYFEGKCSPTGTYSCPDFFYKCRDKNIESQLEKLSCHARIKGRTVSNSEDSSSHQSSDRAERPLDPAPEADRQLGSGDNGIGTKVTNSVLGAAPVLLTATALYRYTPLGPWMRRLGGGRTNNMNAMDTFPPYTPETGDMFSEESANYISYQPM
ncbi:hypothetical protein PVMG_05082 [Plasmodium vivax Mauritania I]|uniref:VIR protein n=1 Tax=Plasmodium vivax Mauritania I TaxID=1035515 RepID=A0A0J9TIW9_PLAVI|nr:hypothetical protein PVMG_05082 [Plasmodium vivax Mauritania I]